MSQTSQYLQNLSPGQSIEAGPLLDAIVRDAVQTDASDIHIEPWEDCLMVRLRLNGVLNELVQLPLDLMDRVSGRVKVMANLVTFQNSLPQEGHVAGRPDLGDVELRVSVFPTVRGEKIVIRIFDPHSRSFDLSQLGFEKDTLKSILSLISRPSGLFLLTGPTGSGKTTAIYAALCYIIQRTGSSISINTVEDPVEFHLPMVSQAQVNPAQEFTYPVALRSLMRQDPQVIMIGEIRDAETAAIAVQAGLTGHMVISTIHTANTAGVFARLINMDIEPFLLASSMSGVLGLRLVRKNCPHCSNPYQPEPNILRVVPPEAVAVARFLKGTGCEACQNTGFLGRSALSELLVVNEAFRDAILKKMPTRALQQIAIDQGMQNLWQNGLRRALSGQTTLEEILRVIALDQL